jgi:hypothetical protein
VDRRRRWTWALVALAVVALVVLALLVWGGDDDAVDTSGSSTTTTSTTSTSSSDTAPPSSSSTTQAEPAPGPVTVLRAGPGGGSGEVVLDWNAVSGATGYRVLRAATAAGPFAVVADFDVTTGSTSAADEVVNLWSEQHSYVPADGALGSPDTSPRFQYVEVDGTGSRCFVVVARNGSGDGAESAPACGSPP